MYNLYLLILYFFPTFIILGNNNWPDCYRNNRTLKNKKSLKKFTNRELGNDSDDEYEISNLNNCLQCKYSKKYYYCSLCIDTYFIENFACQPCSKYIPSCNKCSNSRTCT